MKCLTEYPRQWVNCIENLCVTQCSTDLENSLEPLYKSSHYFINIIHSSQNVYLIIITKKTKCDVN